MKRFNKYITLSVSEAFIGDHMKTEVKKDPFIFQWARNTAGYEWVNGSYDEDVHLIPRDEPGMGIDVYEPPIGLFLEFADLSANKKAIQEFASHYGDLFNSYGLSDLAIPESWMREQSHTFQKWPAGQSLEAWKTDIGDMRNLVAFWDDIRHKRLTNLKKIIKRTDRDISYSINGRWVLLEHSDFDWRVYRFAPKDILLPAKFALQAEINRRLRAPRTLTFSRLAFTPENDQRIIFRPSNLLAGLWLQFAQAVTGKFRLRECAFCRKPFQIGPGGRKSNAQTCSDKCKLARWREDHEPH